MRLVCYKICYDIDFLLRPAGDITAVWSHTRKYCSIVVSLPDVEQYLNFSAKKVVY